MTLILDPNLLLNEIQQLQAAGNLDAMLLRCQQGVQAFPENEEFHKKLAYAQAHYVEEKLQSTILKDLAEKKDYITLHKVYKKLQEIFPDSQELKGLLRKIERQLKSAHSQEREHYIAASSQAVEAFLREGKVDSALQACEELLSYAPYDSGVKKLSRKVSAVRISQINQAVENYFDKHRSDWSEDAKNHPSAYLWV